MKSDDNYQFYLKANVSNYLGQWVAICGHKIVASGHDVKKVYKEAREKCPKEKPLLTRIPDNEAMIF